MAIINKCESRKLKTVNMEIAVAQYLNYRVNLIVPNVCWGMDIHECDLLVITPSGYGWEIEIKVEKADLIKDKLKRHNHTDPRIKNLYFAIPKYLEPYIKHIPERAGIISVYFSGNGDVVCKTTRKPISNPRAHKFSAKERYQVARLGALRIWGLKRKLRDCNINDNATQ